MINNGYIRQSGILNKELNVCQATEKNIIKIEIHFAEKLDKDFYWTKTREESSCLQLAAIMSLKKTRIFNRERFLSNTTYFLRPTRYKAI